MSKFYVKKKFIEEINELIRNDPTILSEEAIEFWTTFTQEKEKPEFTDNGKLILKYMQETVDSHPEQKAKDIAEGLMMSSRRVSGSIRKLVTDGYVEKIGQDPVIYALTEKGKNKIIEE